MKIILEKDEKREKPRYILKHFVVEANEKELKKLDSFSKVLIDVASDMGLKAYEDDMSHLIGADY
tara:strand:- start:4730 stop:4924 length:195 start_codon:yes stop_codon:yes gene_type:complete